MYPRSRATIPGSMAADAGGDGAQLPQLLPPEARGRPLTCTDHAPSGPEVLFSGADIDALVAVLSEVRASAAPVGVTMNLCRLHCS